MGSDRIERIEFDQSQSLGMERVATLTHFVRMLRDDLGDASSNLGHPFVRDRVASAFASTLLTSMPQSQSDALEAAAASIAPFSVHRVERFIEENALSALPNSPARLASARERCRWPFAAFATRRLWRVCGR
jgi:hypothetical protein